MGGKGSGGLRPGAGRKTLDGDPREKVSVTMPTWLLKRVREESERRQMPTSGVITELIKKGLER